MGVRVEAVADLALLDDDMLGLFRCDYTTAEGLRVNIHQFCIYVVVKVFCNRRIHGDTSLSQKPLRPFTFLSSAEFSPLPPITFKPPVACVSRVDASALLSMATTVLPGAIALPALMLMAVATSASALLVSRAGRTANPACP